MNYQCDDKPSIINCSAGVVYIVGTGDFRPDGKKCTVYILNGTIETGNIIVSSALLDIRNTDDGPDYRKKDTDTCKENNSYWTEV